MGLCVSGNRPSTSERTITTSAEHRQTSDHGIGERYARPASPSLDQRVRGAKTAKIPVEVYGREEARLRDLFSALRTGLVFTSNEFSVLPGISTTAPVKFSIGSSARMEASAARQTQEDVNSSEDEDGEEVYELKVSLYGATWTRGTQMELTLWPVVGMFAKRKMVFSWRENVLRVLGSNRGELNARALPIAFDTETDFCRCCLLLAYHGDSSSNLHVEEAETDTLAPSGHTILTLSSIAYHTAVSNLDAVPKDLTIPLKLLHQLYGPEEPVTLSIKVWPSTYGSKFPASPVMKVKAGLVFAEFVHLLKEHFHLPANHIVKLYNNYRPIQPSELVSSSYKSIDCFVISYHEEEEGEVSSSLGSGLEEATDSNATLVVSLVGHDVQNVEACLEMRLRDFDQMLRSHFKLGSDSFLVILAEDDFSPQYTSCDSWKCIYPFSLPESSFGAGLRRSMRRLSLRQQRRSSQRRPRAATRQLPMEVREQVFIPEIDEIVKLISSNSRNFPSSEGRFGLSVDELYENMPMYQLSLDQCGIHPYAIIQVFEVTGPSIPIKFRVLSEHEHASKRTTDGKANDPPRVSRHANVMDINPKWSIHTFLQYVDAVISPAARTRRKRVSLNDRFIEDSEDLSTLSLGGLLDLWKPTWWHRNGGNRQLSVRDIDPAEFLLVEKHSQSSARQGPR